MLREVINARSWLIGIDDTDNLESRGTGHRARCLIDALEEAGLARGAGVTRHQLLVDDRIPYTSHNSSACLQIRSATPAAELFSFCRAFMLEHAADGSDVGLCLATPSQGQAITSYGRRAKHEVLNQDLARAAAASAAILVEGLTGTRDGIIGCLAAVGLFADGNDGRYLWQGRLRELTDQILSVDELLDATGMDDIQLFGGASITEHAQARISLGPWPRPVRIDGHSVLLVDELADNEHAEYECIDKRRLKIFRP